MWVPQNSESSKLSRASLAFFSPTMCTNAKFLTMSHCETLPYFSKSSCKAPRLHWSGRFPTYNLTSFSTSSCWLFLLSVPSPLASDVVMSAVSVFSSFWFFTSARLSWLTSSLAILKSWTAPTSQRDEGDFWCYCLEHWLVLLWKYQQRASNCWPPYQSLQYFLRPYFA